MNLIYLPGLIYIYCCVLWDREERERERSSVRFLSSLGIRGDNAQTATKLGNWENVIYEKYA